MTTIIAVCGRKQSGKTTCSNFIHGYLMRQNLVVEEFKINELGQLVVTALFRDELGNPTKGMGVLDLSQKTPELESFASSRIWPIVKSYNFADALKEVCVGLLGLSYEQCYGTDEQKNTLTNIRWENMAGVVSHFEDKYGNIADDYGLIERKPGLMTAREVLQYVGTQVFRRMNPNIWVDTVCNQIQDDRPEVAVIADARFENEVESIKSRGGLLVRLLRNCDNEDRHESEIALDNYQGWDYVIDNRNMTVEEMNQELLKFLLEKQLVRPLSFDMIG